MGQCTPSVHRHDDGSCVMTRKNGNCGVDHALSSASSSSSLPFFHLRLLDVNQYLCLINACKRINRIRMDSKTWVGSIGHECLIYSLVLLSRLSSSRFEPNLIESTVKGMLFVSMKLILDEPISLKRFAWILPMKPQDLIKAEHRVLQDINWECHVSLANIECIRAKFTQLLS